MFKLEMNFLSYNLRHWQGSGLVSASSDLVTLPANEILFGLLKT